MRLRDRIATAVLGLALVLAVAATAAAQGFTFVVSSSGTSTVAQLDQAGSFVNLYDPSGAGGLNQPADLTFGPDGLLYVAGSGSGSVRRDVGANLGAFVAAGNGLVHPEGLAFGPDGHLYVTTDFNHAVLRFDGATGALMGVFATGGLNRPAGLAFGPDGNLYVVPALKVTLEVGQQFDSAQGEIRDSTLAVVATYTLSGVKITAVPISGEAPTSVLTQEIVTSGKTLAFTTPWPRARTDLTPGQGSENGGRTGSRASGRSLGSPACRAQVNLARRLSGAERLERPPCPSQPRAASGILDLPA